MGAAKFEILAFNALMKKLHESEWAVDCKAWLRSIKERKPPNERPELVKELRARLLIDEAGDEIESTLKDGLRELLVSASQKEKVASHFKGITMVLAGGGCGIPLYKEVIRELMWELEPNPRVEVLEYPPDDLKMGMLNRSTFYRFASAYGLSHDVVNLPEIKGPGEIDNLGINELYHVREKGESSTPDPG